ncbi:MAG: VOC family protein [Pseudomonadota bacterium]
MPQDNAINYIELPMRDKGATESFYHHVFGWTFQRWGEHYISFHGAGMDGGFDGEGGEPASPGALVVLYASNLESKRDDILHHGGKIVQDIFSFPGGRRFHFEDPNGNQLAVWSEEG